tara:strand:+ start:60 stop:533 length:474 start_codon:yes stop_codon:yes gene_type:complete
MLIYSEKFTDGNLDDSNLFQDEIYEKFENELKLLKPTWNHIPSIKADIQNIARDLGFIGRYPVELGVLGERIKFKYKKIGCNVQLGHKTFFLKDLVHFQHLYNKQEINEVLYICFSEHAVAKSYSSNLVSFERSLESIKVFKGIFNVPVYFISLMRE